MTALQRQFEPAETMTNLEVVKAWGKGLKGSSPHMMSDGNRLYSYELQIGEWRDGLPVVFNYTATPDGNPFGHVVESEGFYSVTTSQHVGLARRVGYCFKK